MGWLEDAYNKGSQAVQSVGKGLGAGAALAGGYASEAGRSPAVLAAAPLTAGWAAAYNYFNDMSEADKKARDEAKKKSDAIIQDLMNRERDVKNYVDSQNQALAQWVAEQKRQAAEQEAKDRAATEAANLEFEQSKRSLMDQSEAFDRNQEGMITGLAAEGQQGERLSLADQLDQADRIASNRGLTHSGIREGARAALIGNTAEQLAAERQAINDQVRSQGDAYRAMAAATTRDYDQQILQQYNDRAKNAQNIYSQGLQARRQKLNQDKGFQSLYGADSSLINATRGAEPQPESGFFPALAGAAGTVLGAGVQKLAKNEPTPKTVTTNGSKVSVGSSSAGTGVIR